MREYETVYLLKPDIPSEQLEAVKEKFSQVIRSTQGHLLSLGDWGKRKLAYDVQKNHHGHFIYLRYLGASELVAQLERLLRIDDNVMKFLTVKLNDDVNVEEKLAAGAPVPEAPEEIHGSRPFEGGGPRRGGFRGGKGKEERGAGEVPEPESKSEEEKV